MPFDQDLIQEIEQAVMQKQALMASLSNPELDQSQKIQINQKITDTTIFLNKFYASLEINQNLNNGSKPSLNELNLQAKLEALQKTLEIEIQQNSELQNMLKNVPAQLINTSKIANIINQNYEQSYQNLSDRIIQNTSVLTGASPKTLKDYLYLGWDYLVRDRLPKLLSTRLFLVLGGGFITERLGSDTTLKIVSIVILVVFYILSEMVVKLASKTGNGVRLY